MAKILIVEDNESIRAIVRMSLEMRSHEVVEATNGQEGLEALKASPDYALMITDIAMPVMDGFQLISRVRNELGMKQLPIIVLTAEKDASLALDLGATRLIRKPFSPIELLEAVRNAIGG